MSPYQFSYDCQLMDNHVPYTVNVSYGMQRAVTQRFSGGYNLFILDIEGGVTIYTINDDNPTGNQQQRLNDIIVEKDSSIKGDVKMEDISVVYLTGNQEHVGDTDTFWFFIFNNNGSSYLGVISQGSGQYASMKIDATNAQNSKQVRLLTPQAVCNVWPGNENAFPVVIALNMETRPMNSMEPHFPMMFLFQTIPYLTCSQPKLGLPEA